MLKSFRVANHLYCNFLLNVDGFVSEITKSRTSNFRKSISIFAEINQLLWKFGKFQSLWNQRIMHGVRSPRDKSPLNGWSAQRGALAWAVYLDHFWLDGGGSFFGLPACLRFKKLLHNYLKCS